MAIKDEKVNPPCVEFDRETYLITRIRNPLDPEAADEIVWLVPKDEEECQARYGCALSEAIAAGVRKWTTSPDYYQAGYIGETIDGKFIPKERKANAQEEMQGLADVYQPGRKAAVGETVKSKAKKLDEINSKLAETGKSAEDILKMAQEMGLL